MARLQPCRNCGEIAAVERAHGFLSPFFLLRAYGVSPLKRTRRRRFFTLPKRHRAAAFLLLRRLYGDGATSGLCKALELETPPEPLLACGVCHFVGAKREFPEEQLLRFYVDYRGATYNQDRISVEPGYADIMDMVGKSELEIKNRLANVDALLQRFDVSGVDTILDVGGGRGEFIPTAFQRKKVTVLEVSDEPLISPSYTRRERIDPSDRFDFIQINHVLEHVSNPRKFLADHLAHLKPGGLCYIELPQDKNDEELARLRKAGGRSHFGLHEHINLYCRESARRVGEALGLKALSVQRAELDYGWTNQHVISALFQKVA